MPSCCLTVCRNRSENGYRLFRIPTAKSEDHRKKAWIAFINRSDLPERASLCEAHFEADQFELNRLDNRKLLKRSAVPTVRTLEFPQNQGIKRKQSDLSADMSTALILTTQEQLETTTTLHAGSSSNNSDQEEKGQLKYLQNELRAAKAKIAALKNQIRNLEETFKVIFSEDQIHLLRYGNHRGKEWSDETIQKAFKLYMACGTKCYEELHKQKYPLPAIRTLQLRIENLKFNPGVLDVFQLLIPKVATFEEHEKHAVLLLDEMAIKPSLQFDNSTKSVLGRPTMLLSGNLDSSNKELASHVLVFMLAGMSTRWKSYSADEVLKKLPITNCFAFIFIFWNFFRLRRESIIPVTINTLS